MSSTQGLLLAWAVYNVIRCINAAARHKRLEARIQELISSMELSAAQKAALLELKDGVFVFSPTRAAISSVLSVIIIVVVGLSFW